MLMAKMGMTRQEDGSERRGGDMNMVPQPYALAREEGQALWFLDSLLIVKATGEQTGGAFGLIDNVMPPGDSPYHVHHNEDEAFYVLEGEMTFYVGAEKIKAEPGTWVYGPREVPHGFRIEGVSPARMLLLNTPAGFEQFPVEVGEPARELTLPPAEPPDIERLMSVAATYDIEILGPLPDH
jgi:quercetin dioxygenase-like cupin family protein